jgi:hypothetical protein
VLHVLLRGDQPGVQHLGLGLLLDELLGLLEQPLHADALLARGLLAEPLADAGEALGLALGLLEVRRQELLELGVLGRLDHARQALLDLRLGAVEVLQLLDVERVQRVHLHGRAPGASGAAAGAGAARARRPGPTQEA